MATDSSYTDEAEFLIVTDANSENRKAMLCVTGVRTGIAAVKNYRTMGYTNVKMERFND